MEPDAFGMSCKTGTNVTSKKMSAMDYIQSIVRYALL